MDGLNFDAYMSMYNVLDEKCTTHNVQMMQVKEHIREGLEPFCVACAAEQVKKEEDEMSRASAEAHLKATTYNWLSNLSVLSDETLRSATFDSYEEVEDETKINKKKARVTAGRYLKNEVFNTIMSGLPGTGKSHLSMSILQAVNEHSEPYRKCVFISVDELMRRIKDSFNNPESKYTEQRMIDVATKADLLVLDDLGAETGAISSNRTATDFTTRTLYAIVNGRQNKSTIITTNLSSAELNQMYDRKLLSRLFRGTKGNILTFNDTRDKRTDITF